LKDPIRVELNRDQVAPQSLVHHFQHTGLRDRLNVLVEYLHEKEVSQAIIFCNSRHHGEKLLSELKGKVNSLEYIHGGLEQSRRTSIFERFRRKEIMFMIATDVAGRGLDFSHVSHVINYDYPLGLESYIHRTGRTGRMGRSGIAMTFVTDKDLVALKALLQTNRIDPVWRGAPPDMENLSKRKKRGEGKKPFTKKHHKTVSKRNATGGGEWQRQWMK
jgi:ATP-dependent RNA helicase DeaD